MPSEPYKSLWKSNCVISSSNKWNVLKMETNYQVISFWKIMCYWIFFLCICWERGWNWFYPNGSWLQRLNCLKECIYRFGVYITVSFLYIYIIYCYWYSFYYFWSASRHKRTWKDCYYPVDTKFPFSLKMSIWIATNVHSYKTIAENGDNFCCLVLFNE